MTVRSSDEPLAPGTRIGPFRVVQHLGGGAFGEVYQGVDPRGVDYALKWVRDGRRSVRRRLARERRLQARLEHPNVVRMFDVELEHEGCPVLVMEYVAGSTLHAWLSERGPPDLATVDRIARDIVAGVAEAHRRAVVHRDLKPDNILIASDGRARVGDFGLARCLQGAAGTTLTRRHVPMGTAQYMAPEQVEDAHGAREPADLFALGCVLYELLTARPAFPAGDPAEVWQRMREGRYRPIREVRPDCPERMERAIAGCLLPDRRRRIPTCHTLAAVWDGGAWEPPGADELPTMIGGPGRRDLPPWTDSTADETRIAQPQGAQTLPDPSPAPAPSRDGGPRRSWWPAGLLAGLFVGAGLAAVPLAAVALRSGPDPTTTPPSAVIGAPTPLPPARVAPGPWPEPAPAALPSRRHRAPPAPAHLDVITPHGGWAWVSVDGERIERTAPIANVPLSPGQHVVRIENEVTGLDHTEPCTVGPGERCVVEVPSGSRAPPGGPDDR